MVRVLVLAALLGGAIAVGAGEKLTAGGFTLELPLGLQAGAAYVPDDDPPTAQKIALGRLLYFDPRLSKDATIACASCHNPYHGFTDPARTSKGVGGKLGGRNSPTVLNRLFSKEQFWDGRAADLEAQAKGPLVNPVEMAMPNHDAVVKRVDGIKGYKPHFAAAFGDGKVTIDRIAQAIASYERTVVTGDSAYDRWVAGQKDALAPSAVRGMDLFNGKANCKVCHAGFNFTDESYHNIGVGMLAAKPDLGRFEQTKTDTDRGAYKTPTLRNVALTAPYMHDGSEVSLREVVLYYDKGGNPNQWLSKEMKPLHLSPAEVDDLVAFLESLTGDVAADVGPPASLPQ